MNVSIAKTTQSDLFRLSVVIKTLNEEHYIDRAISSVLKATSGINTEVLVVDSQSTDRTVEYALKWPVTVLQLMNAQLRNCGIGPEIGYRHARGEFLLLMDGDMEICEGFIEEAIAIMAQDPSIAGVGGFIEEMRVENLAFLKRARASKKVLLAGYTDRLAGGGLFRRSLLDKLGYFTDRNLHSFEEYELGLRIRSCGYRLWRISQTCFRHYGHSLPTLQLLALRTRSGYARGPGEVLRSALGKPWFIKVAWEFKLFIIVALWWVLLIPATAFVLRDSAPLTLLVFTGVVALILSVIRHGSIRHGGYSPLAWSVFSLNSILGFFSKRLSVVCPIEVHLFSGENTERLTDAHLRPLSIPFTQGGRPQ